MAADAGGGGRHPYVTREERDALFHIDGLRFVFVLWRIGEDGELVVEFKDSGR